MQWFHDLGIRSKFYVIFSTIVLSIIGGIVVGQVSFMRIQVGGKLYKSVILKKDVVLVLDEISSGLEDGQTIEGL